MMDIVFVFRICALNLHCDSAVAEIWYTNATCTVSIKIIMNGINAAVAFLVKEVGRRSTISIMWILLRSDFERLRLVKL